MYLDTNTHTHREDRVSVLDRKEMHVVVTHAICFIVKCMRREEIFHLDFQAFVGWNQLKQ